MEKKTKEQILAEIAERRAAREQEKLANQQQEEVVIPPTAEQIALQEQFIQRQNQKIQLNNQIDELEIWFKWYDTQVMQYNRAIRLNVSTDIDIADLDVQAVTKAAQLKSYRQQYEALCQE